MRLNPPNYLRTLPAAPALALYESSTPLRSALNVSPYSPQNKALSQARRGRVVKPNDFGCRHHHSKGIAVLFLNHQESLADMWPGGPEAVIASRNAVVVSRQIAEHFRATRLGINR